MEDEALAFQEVTPTSKKEKDMAGYTALWTSEGFKASKDGRRHNLGLHFKVSEDCSSVSRLHVPAA